MNQLQQSTRTQGLDTHPGLEDTAAILRELLAGYCGPVAVELWNGETVIGDEPSSCRIVFHRPEPLRDLILHRDLLRLAEAYLREEVDVEGDIEAVFDLADFIQTLSPPWPKRFHLLRHALRLQAGIHPLPALGLLRTQRRNTKASIAYHYDVSNDFYRLWLDPQMVYSCAYFKDGGQSLAAAQCDKLDRICRKLCLAPDQTLLDIGCGWGALVCWAARNYGVRATGITLSAEQHTLASERIEREGLKDRVRVELRDYRDLAEEERFDRIVSVGMFEHIGVRNFPLYFGKIRRLLKPGGLFLNHGITNDTGWRDTPLTRFINRYVFPDGELARISHVITAMEDTGFEIIDVEGMRRHYALTLRRWVEALRRQKTRAVEIAGERIYRIWQLYMAGSAHYFDEGSLGVYQVLAGCARNPLATPLRRKL